MYAFKRLFPPVEGTASHDRLDILDPNLSSESVATLSQIPPIVTR